MDSRRAQRGLGVGQGRCGGFHGGIIPAAGGLGPAAGVVQCRFGLIVLRLQRIGDGDPGIVILLGRGHLSRRDIDAGGEVGLGVLQCFPCAGDGDVAGILGGLDELLLVGVAGGIHRVPSADELVAVRSGQREQHLPGLDRVADLDLDGRDLPGLVQRDGIVLIGRHGTGAAHLGGDLPAGDGLGGHLRQGAVHDGVGKEGQRQHHRQKDDGGVFDPISFFDFDFIHISLPLNATGIGYALDKVFLAVQEQQQ